MDLNEQQREAAQHGAGPLLIIADRHGLDEDAPAPRGAGDRQGRGARRKFKRRRGRTIFPTLKNDTRVVFGS